MKNLLCLALWLPMVLLALYAGLRPEAGALYDNPLACLGVGLIGLGLTLEARRRVVPVRVPAETARGSAIRR